MSSLSIEMSDFEQSPCSNHQVKELAENKTMSGPSFLPSDYPLSHYFNDSKKYVNPKSLANDLQRTLIRVIMGLFNEYYGRWHDSNDTSTRLPEFKKEVTTANCLYVGRLQAEQWSFYKKQLKKSDNLPAKRSRARNIPTFNSHKMKERTQTLFWSNSCLASAYPQGKGNGF